MFYFRLSTLPLEVSYSVRLAKIFSSEYQCRKVKIICFNIIICKTIYNFRKCYTSFLLKDIRLSNMNFRLKSFFRTFWFFSYQNFPVARWFLWLHEVTVWFNFTVFGILITSRPKLQFKVNIILNFYNVVLNWLWPAICLCWKKI